ncbi:unnamed protein product [Periconia digitata]|uniref:Pentatricopeptide repeat domain-containing protein n=1 Tax=Periconia digitata TaxID=1303443 RepID=A0A9W4UPZ3_9PLEO|nr:unnamed protein product [Periconia digitata]
MPPALDRLLASPSALRLLRAAINASEPPTAYLGTVPTSCCSCRTHSRRAYQIPRRKTTPLVNWTRFSKNEPQQNVKRKPSRILGLDSSSSHDQKPDNVRAWAEHLQLKARLEGKDGIRQVWAAREGVFDLPTSDTPDADYLWATFFRVPDLVLPTILHAAEVRRKTGQLHPRLYELCMNYWLQWKRYLDQARDYHHQLLFHLQLRKLPLKSIARHGRQHFTSESYAALMDIYRTSNEKDVYDEVVPILCARGSVRTAQQWHTLCTRRGDLPSPRVAEQRAIQALIAAVSDVSDPEAHFVSLYAGHPKMNSDLLQRLKGRETAPVRFDDSVCSKLFATRSFSVENVISGLAMVGVNEIGPLAVRAMATTAESNTLILQSFEALKASGIALQGSTFSVALEKFASDGRWHLVHSMLQSDQHVDVYDNMDLQKELLDFYLKKQDWAQVHRTLAIMSLFHADMGTESWNLLLQAQVSQFEPDQILHTLQIMREKDVVVYTSTLVALKSLLRPRRPTRKPGRSPHGKFDDLRFVTRVFLMISDAKIGNIMPEMWRELIKRYGITGRLRELRRLLIILLSSYALRQGKHEIHTVHRLLPGGLQQGLIVWGFRQALLPNAPWEQSMLAAAASKKWYRRRFVQKGILHHLDWSIGLKTVVEFRDMGLVVHPHNVVKALQIVFINLFGRGHSKKRENVRMSQANQISYPTYVRKVNEIWGEPLLVEPRFYGRSKVHGLMWHPQLPRSLLRKYIRVDGPWNTRAGYGYGGGGGEAGKDLCASATALLRHPSRPAKTDVGVEERPGGASTASAGKT